MTLLVSLTNLFCRWIIADIKMGLLTVNHLAHHHHRHHHHHQQQQQQQQEQEQEQQEKQQEQEQEQEQEREREREEHKEKPTNFNHKLTIINFLPISRLCCGSPCHRLLGGNYSHGCNRWDLIVAKGIHSSNLQNVSHPMKSWLGN